MYPCKRTVEKELARSLKENSSLKLADDVKVLTFLQSEMERQSEKADTNGRWSFGPLVQYVVCLAVTEAIMDLALKNGIPPLDVRIKWPNDLYLDAFVSNQLNPTALKLKEFCVHQRIHLRSLMLVLVNFSFHLTSIASDYIVMISILFSLSGVGLNVDNDKPTIALNVVLQRTSAYRLLSEDITSAFLINSNISFIF